MTNTTRPAAVAGHFYPGEGKTLAETVSRLLGAARSGPPPKAIVAPHAGYIYSGPIAASVYARLKPLGRRITRVVLIGPAHRLAVAGLATPGATAFATPLGVVPLDQEALQAIADLPQVVTSPSTLQKAHTNLDQGSGAWYEGSRIRLKF
jgi:AmmeMemoRadiSam system protein B